MLSILLTALAWLPPVLGYGSLLRAGVDPALRRAVSGMLGLILLAVGDASFPNLALALLVLPLANSTAGLGSQGPDQALAIIIPFALVLWVRALESPERMAAEAPAETVVSFFAATINISAAPLAAGAVLLVALHRKSFGARWPAAVALGLLRSVVLSGCLVYPLAATCLSSLPWTPAPAEVKGLARMILAWARTPAQVLASWHWLPGWWARSVVHSLDYFTLSLLIAAGILAGAATVLWSRGGARSFLTTFALAACGALFWFLSAPDPRFGLGFLHALALVLVGAACSFVSTTGVYRFASLRPWPIPLLQWPAIPIARTEARTTDSGFEVNVPVEGADCMAAELPCTPLFDRSLRSLRGLRGLPPGGEALVRAR